MPRPQYTPQELQQYTWNYQVNAYQYANQIVSQLISLDEDEDIEQGSEEYLQQKATLNSLLYQTVDYALNAQQRIEAGYPVQFSSRAIRRISDRMMQDPVYNQTMRQAQFVEPQEDLRLRNQQHAFHEEVTVALPNSMKPSLLAEDPLPDADRARRAVVLRQVLKDFEETGTGYYLPGIRRGSNSQSFENVKTELRRQIAMLEGGMPLSSADDDRMIGLLNTYSDRKRSGRTRAFGNVRQKGIQQLYAEYTQHPAPRAANAPAYPTAQQISQQYNQARGLDDPRYANREDYVDLTREAYRVTPERTVGQEYNSVVAQMRQMTNARAAGNGLMTEEQQAQYQDLVLRAAALNTIILLDPAGPNAAVDDAQVDVLKGAALQNDLVAGSLTAGLLSAANMEEITAAFETQSPQLENGQYVAVPAAPDTVLLARLRTLSQPTIEDRLKEAKDELRELNFNGQAVNQSQRARLRPLAQKILVLQQMAEQKGENGMRAHVSDLEVNGALMQITDTTQVQRAVDTCEGDAQKAQAYVQALLADDATFESMNHATDIQAVGGVRDMIRHERAVLTGMDDDAFNKLEQEAAEEYIVRLAALGQLQIDHKYDPNPNAVVTEEEIRQKMDEVRADQLFMESVQGKMTSVDALHTAASGICSLEYEDHYARALEYRHRIPQEPEAVDMLQGCLEDEIASLIAIRNIQEQTGRPYAYVSEDELAAEVNRVKLSDPYLAMQRGIERNGIDVAGALLDNTFNKEGDAYQQAIGQNWIPMIRTYPYPPFRAGTIGAAYEEMDAALKGNDANTSLARNAKSRQELVNVMVRRLALRQLALEDPEGGYGRMTTQKRNRLNQLEAQLRVDPDYVRAYQFAEENAVNANQTINGLLSATSLPNLKAQYNRAQGADYIDPLAATFIRHNAEEWIDLEQQKLDEATSQPNKEWTDKEKDALLHSYARMYVVKNILHNNPDRGAEVYTRRKLDDEAAQLLKRPGMLQKLQTAFAQPASWRSHTVAGLKQQTMANAQLSEPDKLARMMAIGMLEKDLFDDAVLSQAEVAAAEAAVRQSASYQRLAAHLQAGNALDTIAPAQGENYYDAMQDKSFKLPGTEQSYDARMALLAQELRTLQEEKHFEEAGSVIAQMYVIARYQKDGIPYDQLPPQAEIVRMAGALSKSVDFQTAMQGMQAHTEYVEEFAVAAENRMDADSLGGLLNGYAVEQRLTQNEEDLREPDMLHELRYAIMSDATAKLVQGNALDAWISDEERNTRRDEYIRFTALNRLMTQRSNVAIIPEADIKAEIEKLQADKTFMDRLEFNLRSPIALRNSVFNSAGVQRWSDAGRMNEFHDMLQNAKKAEREDRRGFEHVYGAATEYLAGTIDTRLSGREIDNTTLPTRDLNASVNNVLFSDRFRYMENAIRTNPSEFDRVSNLFKLPADEFKTVYEELTDEYARRYPTAPVKHPATIEAAYENAKAEIKAIDPNDAEAIAADEARRNALAKNIREIVMDRRIILKANTDPQLVRREVNASDVTTSSKLLAVKQRETEAIDRILGKPEELSEKLKDPKAVQSYLTLMGEAGDLRKLMADDHNAKEPYRDPLITQLQESGLSTVADRNAKQADLIQQVLTNVPGETPQQREERLQEQIAQLIADKMYEGIPDDEMPTAAQQETCKNEIKTDPFFRTAVTRLARNQVYLNNFLEDFQEKTLRDTANSLDVLYKEEARANNPDREPSCNFFYNWSDFAINPLEDRLSLVTTGRGLNEWEKGQKEVAVDAFIRYTAYYRLMQENPDRVRFSQAELDAKVKEVCADRRFMDPIEAQAVNGSHLREQLFNYPGNTLYKPRRETPSLTVDVAFKLKEGSSERKNIISGGLEGLVDKMLVRIRGDLETQKKNYHTPNKLTAAWLEEYKKTADFALLERACQDHPELVNKLLFEVHGAPADEFQDRYNSFMGDLREMYNIKEEKKEGEEDEFELDFNGEIRDVQADVEKLNEELNAEREAREQEEKAREQELNGENDLEKDSLADVDLNENIIQEEEAPKAVGWPDTKRDVEPPVYTGDPNSYFNQQRKAMHSVLSEPAVRPGVFTACLENMYIAAMLQKAGKEINPQNVGAHREVLKNDALFQKFCSKCLTDPKFAQEQLKNFTEPDYGKMYGAMKALTPNAYDQVRDQIRWDLTHGNAGADYEQNFRRLYAMSKFGPDAKPTEKEIEQKANELKNDPALKKALSGLTVQKGNQTKLNSGYGLMLVDGVFSRPIEKNVNERLKYITSEKYKQSPEQKYLDEYAPKPTRTLVPGSDIEPKSPAAEFQNNVAKMGEDMLARQRNVAAGQNAVLNEEASKKLAMQACKTVALHNLSQSPAYAGKAVDKDALKAEMLRLKDDPQMGQALQKAIQDPQAEKTLVEGMMRTADNPQAFTSFVQTFGADPKAAQDWLDKTYTQPLNRLVPRTYKPEPKFAGIPQLSGVTVRTDNFTAEEAKDGSQLSEKFTQLKNSANAAYNNYIIKFAEVRKAEAPEMKKKLAEVYAVKQIRASQADPKAEVKDLDEKIQRRAAKLMEDPAFSKVLDAAVTPSNRKEGLNLIDPILSEKPYTNCADQLQKTVDQEYCKQNGLDLQTGKKIQEEQPVNAGPVK